MFSKSLILFYYFNELYTIKQETIATKSLPILHRMEQIASTEHIGTLAENVMEELKHNSSIASEVVFYIFFELHAILIYCLDFLDRKSSARDKSKKAPVSYGYETKAIVKNGNGSWQKRTCHCIRLISFF